MQRLKLALSVSLVTAAIVSLANRRETPLEEHVRAEVRRLHAHFDSVDVELRARNVAHLSQAQRASRAQLADWLRHYRDDASFPLNDGVSPAAVPLFRDSRGVLCAMAYLIQRSGRGDIVNGVAASRNTASIYELATDPRVVAWLDSTGLSIAEAARIQPRYDPPIPLVYSDRNQVSGGYVLSSLALSGAALITLGVNVVQPSRISGILGFVAGSVAMVHGVTRLDDGRGTRRLAAANTGVGVLSMAIAFRGILGSKGPAGPGPVTAKFNNVRLAPTVALLGTPQLGFVMRARF